MSSDNHLAERDLDLAKQWIAFLQRRNTILAFVWPLLLIVALGSGAAAVYFYQGQKVLETELSIQAAAERDLQNALKTERQRSAVLAEEHAQYEAELKRIKTSILDEQGLKDEQQRLSEQLVATLKNKIAALEDDGRALENLLSEKQQQVQQLQLSNKSLEKKSEQLKEQYEVVSSQLRARKTAFEALSARQRETRAEVDRLASLLLKAEQNVQREKTRQQQLNAIAGQREEEFSAMQERVRQLEQRLKSLVSPIAVESVPEVVVPINNAPAARSADTANTEQASHTESPAFDYESIVIDRP